MKKKLFFIASLYFLSFTCILGQEKIEEVVAIVGDKVISKIDLNKQISLSQEKETNLCKELEKLLLSEAFIYSLKEKFSNENNKIDKEKIKLEAETEAEIYLKNIPKEQMNLILSGYKLSTVGELREEIIQKRINAYYIQTYRAQMMEEIDVTPKEVKSFYNQYKDNLPEVEEALELRKILFYPKIKLSHKKEIIAKLQALKEEIEKGASFSKLAILHSQDPGSSADGGLIKGVKKGQMDKKFESIAFSLEKEGELSEPFESSFGFHIVELQKRKGMELDLRHILLIPKYKEDELKEAENFANLIREELIKGRTNFEKLTEEYSEDSYSKKFREAPVTIRVTPNNKIEKNSLSIETSVALAGIEKGDFTYPYIEQNENGKLFFSLSQLIKIIPAHKINFKDDYTILSKYVEGKKIEKKYNDYLEKTLKDTYIRIEKEYQNCDFFKNLTLNNSF